MCGPADLCRFFAGSVMTPIYRDYFSIEIAKNAKLQGNFIIEYGDPPKKFIPPIQINSPPTPGNISFNNSYQYLYNRGTSYDIRELTEFGKTLYKLSRDIGSVDDTQCCISFSYLVAAVAAIILLFIYPIWRTYAALGKWGVAFCAIFSGLTILRYNRNQELHQQHA